MYLQTNGSHLRWRTDKKRNLVAQNISALVEGIKKRRHLLKYNFLIAFYFLLFNKKSRFDFADELKVGDVRYKHLT